MLKLLSTLLLLIASISCAADFSPNSYYTVCFTPAQKCVRNITNDIYHAKQSIEVQAYSFTSRTIAEALVKAQRRGVQVQIIIDRSQLTNPSRLYFLLKNKLPIWVDDKVAIAHNKVMIFDRQAILTGSYNFTNSAEYDNAENALFIHDASLAGHYYQNWLSRQQQSVRLTTDNFTQLRAKYAQNSSDNDN